MKEKSLNSFSFEMNSCKMNSSGGRKCVNHLAVLSQLKAKVVLLKRAAAAMAAAA